jgi:hypothetical protein
MEIIFFNVNLCCVYCTPDIQYLKLIIEFEAAVLIFLCLLMYDRDVIGHTRVLSTCDAEFDPTGQRTLLKRPCAIYCKVNKSYLI